MATTTYTAAGAKATTAAKLDAGVFGVTPESHELLKAAYVAYMANGRENLAVVKTRGLVRGGGKKPWQQKGTGRARAGSSRSPIWKGGGVTHGPLAQKVYAREIPKKMRAKALAIALAVLVVRGRRLVAGEPVELKDVTTEVLGVVGGQIAFIVAPWKRKEKH